MKILRVVFNFLLIILCLQSLGNNAFPAEKHAVGNKLKQAVAQSGEKTTVDITALRRVVAGDLPGTRDFLTNRMPEVVDNNVSYDRITLDVAQEFFRIANDNQREELLTRFIESRNRFKRMSVLSLFSGKLLVPGGEPDVVDNVVTKFCMNYLSRRKVNNDVAAILFGWLIAGPKIDFVGSPVAKNWLATMGADPTDPYAFYAAIIRDVCSPFPLDKVKHAFSNAGEINYEEMGVIWAVDRRLFDNLLPLIDAHVHQGPLALSQDFLRELAEVVAVNPGRLSKMAPPMLDTASVFSMDKSASFLFKLGIITKATNNGRTILDYYVAHSPLSEVMGALRRFSGSFTNEEFDGYATTTFCRMAAGQEDFSFSQASAFARAYFARADIAEASKGANRKKLEQALGLAPTEKTDK